MLVCNPQALKTALESGQRLLGLDVGSKTVGIALSDPRLSIASPHSTLKRGKFSIVTAQLSELVRKEGVGGIVIGLPINMDGSEGRACQSIRQFQKNLAESLDLPMALWDERLSTAAVTRTMIEADLSRKRQKEVVDKMAAAYILQGALDAINAASSVASD
jgi:putative Holliday junction resolvase